MSFLHTFQPSSVTIHNRCCAVLILLAALLLSLSSTTSFAQSPSPRETGVAEISGTVQDSAGKPVAVASVFLEGKGQSKPLETKTNADGTFVFSALGAGTYTVTAEKSGLQKGDSTSMIVSAGEKKHVNLVLVALGVTRPGPSGASPAAVASPGALEFEDMPDFKVAGVSDWSDLGLHASDTNGRTSEALAKKTFALKSDRPDGATTGISDEERASPETRASENDLRAAVAEDPKSFEANHKLGVFYAHSQKYREAIPLLKTAFRINPGDQTNAYDLALAYKATGDGAWARDQVRQMLPYANTAGLQRLLGDLDEQLGDPLTAVREYETAVRLDPSEQNYFDWGAELLLHKAAQPAAEVFTKGSMAHPNSARMLAGLGAALYAGGAYEDAARRLCDASDLKPADPAPYLFLGEMEVAASAPLPCGEQMLARFVREQPENALANYYYAVALRRRERASDNPATAQQAEALLEKAVTIDPKLGEAFLQLGDLYFERKDFVRAIGAYEKAIEVKPDLSQAHYQLGLAFKRTGAEAKARQEFRAYEQAEKTEAAERQRRQVRQFMIILQDQSPASPPQ